MDINYYGKNSLYVIKNLLLAIMITTTIITMDYIFRYCHGMPIPTFRFHTWYGLFLIGVAISFLKHSVNAIIIYTVMIFSLFIQFVHFNYFGNQISPEEITLFFTHSSETMTDFAGLIRLALVPSLMCLGALVTTFIAFYFFSSRIKFRWAWILLILVFLLPIKSIITSIMIHKVGKNPHHSLGDRPNADEDFFWISNQKLWVFYTTYTLPHELFFPSPLPQIVQPPLNIVKHKPKVNIIYIQGESLTWKHMSLYGYHRETTPYLDSLKNNPNFIFKKGISAGVSTDVSLPEFFNMVERPNGTRQIASSNRNLFKMAQNNGFITYFISTHYKKWFGLITTYLYPAYINHFAILGVKNAILDKNLLPFLNHANLNIRHFLVLQLAGSHESYESRYPPSFDLFKPKPNATFQQTQIDTYDNSVLYTDAMMKNIVDIVKKKTKLPTYIIFTSDHGESLGYKGKFGHNHLDIRQVHQVPMIIMALNGASLDFIKSLDQQDFNKNYMSHYELELIIAHLLGYQVPQFSTQKQGYYITGPILNGSAGFEHLTFDPTTGKQHMYYHAVE